MLCVCFYFQAEDGIRDLVRSRVLGDVYKRQRRRVSEDRRSALGHRREGAPHLGALGAEGGPGDPEPVSYTHLTLPTSDLV